MASNMNARDSHVTRGVRPLAPDPSSVLATVVPITSAQGHRGSPPKSAMAKHSDPDNAAIVSAFIAGEPTAATALFDAYGPHMRRIVTRLLGSDTEYEDVLHDAITRVLGSINNLRDPEALGAWITQITVRSARDRIRKRTRGRWLWFLASEDVPEVATEPICHDTQRILARVYHHLDALDPLQRVVLALHDIERMSLAETAAASGLSVATVKRKLSRARAAFIARARNDPWLADRVAPEDP